MTARNPNVVRGIFNCNPGNLRRSADPWQGLAEQQNDPEFFTFVSMEYGIRAMARVLIAYQDRHGIRSIRRIINRYAPPTENKTASYIDVVASRSGFRPDDEIDLHTYAHMRPLIEAMVEVECGRGHGIPAKQFDEGLRLAGIVDPTPKTVTQTVTQTHTGQATTLVAAAGVVGTAASQAAPVLDTLGKLSPVVAVALIVVVAAGVILWRWKQS